MWCTLWRFKTLSCFTFRFHFFAVWFVIPIHRQLLNKLIIGIKNYVFLWSTLYNWYTMSLGNGEINFILTVNLREELWDPREMPLYKKKDRGKLFLIPLYYFMLLVEVKRTPKRNCYEPCSFTLPLQLFWLWILWIWFSFCAQNLFWVSYPCAWAHHFSELCFDSTYNYPIF